MYKLFLLLIASLLLTSCSTDKYKKLKISTTSWIGYLPLYYAKEKGWLEQLNIKLLSVGSLGENMYIYQGGNSDAFVGTQYEYNMLAKKDLSLIPIILFDRSNGGDVIMSNLSIKKLQEDKISTIDAYLEMDSINNTLFQDFLKNYNLEDKTIHYLNHDQLFISTLKNKDTKKPTIIVTYDPYDIELQKNGFTNIASTKENLKLLVIDAMFTKQKTFDEHKEQFTALKKLVDNAIYELDKNPDEFYETIKEYIPKLKYEEFKSSLNGIIWINKDISLELKKRIKKSFNKRLK